MTENVQGSTNSGPALLPEDLEGWLVFSPDLKELAADASIVAPEDALALIGVDWLSRWSKGQAPPVEVYLELCQDWCHRDLQWRLVEMELEFATAHGASCALNDYLLRLPQWSPELEHWFLQRTRAENEPATLSITTAPRAKSLDDTVRSGRDKTVRVQRKTAKLADSAKAESGDIFAGYRILEILPSHTAIVRYRALDLERRLEVELTVPARDFADDVERCGRLNAGLALFQELQSGGGVAPHYSGWHGERPFVAVECAIGSTLASQMAAGESCGAEGAGWVAQVAKLLSVCHRRGLEYVGPTPESIWIDERGCALLSPAALFERDADGAETPWRAPETFVATERLNGRSDVYALGALLHLVLAGRAPLTAKNRQAVSDVVATPAAGTPLPDNWKAVCERALALDSRARYSNADDLATELESQAEQRQLLASLIAPGLVSLVVLLVVLPRRLGVELGLVAAVEAFNVQVAWTSVHATGE